MVLVIVDGHYCVCMHAMPSILECHDGLEMPQCIDIEYLCFSVFLRLWSVCLYVLMMVIWSDNVDLLDGHRYVMLPSMSVCVLHVRDVHHDQLLFVGPPRALVMTISQKHLCTLCICECQ